MDFKCQVAHIFYFFKKNFSMMVHHAMLGIRAGDA